MSNLPRLPRLPSRNVNLNGVRHIVRNRVIGTRSEPIIGIDERLLREDTEEEITAFDKAYHIAEGLDDKSRTAVLEQTLDTYYWDDDEYHAILKLEGDELRNHLIAALMNYFYPGTI